MLTIESLAIAIVYICTACMHARLSHAGWTGVQHLVWQSLLPLRFEGVLCHGDVYRGIDEFRLRKCYGAWWSSNRRLNNCIQPEVWIITAINTQVMTSYIIIWTCTETIANIITYAHACSSYWVHCDISFSIEYIPLEAHKIQGSTQDELIVSVPENNRSWWYYNYMLSSCDQEYCKSYVRWISAKRALMAAILL